ncbi:MAG: prepilin-type N-terminal cleavage/methylation domain-containing protein [Gammaproteobacteria bacterium]|nr:MAG: prepilin-type N-terminal cleavage/methylation domain-containing protein [Gammaproteobacteria bacterium]UTW44063.1 GspH/FimT family pseudopilin [bacterium SCSIO 12844]
MQVLGGEKIKKVSIQGQIGLTLIELLIVLTILSLLVGGTIISWNLFFKKNQATVTIDKVYMLLTYAKAKSYQSRLPVIVCSSVDNKTCIDGLWQNQLLVFIDHNANKRFDGDDKLINHHLRLPKGFILRWQGFPRGNYLQFKPVSLLSSSNGTLTLCHKDKNDTVSRALIISKSAMIRYAETKNDKKQLACA